jgi:cytochrome c553
MRMGRSTMPAMLLGAATLIFGFCEFAHAQTAPQAPDPEFRAAMAWVFPKAHSPDPSASGLARKPRPEPNEIVRVPGSTQSYTRAQLDADDSFPDWFPHDHPPAPRIVMHGKSGFPLPCADCHMPNGQGDITSPALAGLPRAYIIEQITAFRQGARSTPLVMTREARAISDADLDLASSYFSKLAYDPRLRVIETATVPKTHWVDFVLVPNRNGAREPIGERIIETSTDIASHIVGDYHVGNVAWVPPGSIARGAVIASKGTGKALPCESCHGPALRGTGDIPPLAGRSPAYIVRELIRFRLGQRTNPGAAPMRLEASGLTLKDMIDVAAYAASRKP